MKKCYFNWSIAFLAIAVFFTVADLLIVIVIGNFVDSPLANAAFSTLPLLLIPVILPLILAYLFYIKYNKTE